MVVHLLCPSCANTVGDIHPFLALCKIKHNRDANASNQTAQKYAGFRHGAVPPIGYILDAGGLFNVCCRMHVICATQYDKHSYHSHSLA